MFAELKAENSLQQINSALHRKNSLCKRRIPRCNGKISSCKRKPIRCNGRKSFWSDENHPAAGERGSGAGRNHPVAGKSRPAAGKNDSVTGESHSVVGKNGSAALQHRFFRLHPLIFQGFLPFNPVQENSMQPCAIPLKIA